MKKLRKAAAVIGLTFAVMFGMAPAAQAANCYYQAPTAGYQQGWYVHYYNCKGGYWASNYPPHIRYYCWTDFDVWAEWSGQVDRWVWVWAVSRCDGV